MNTPQMIERNRRDLLKQMGYIHFADALDKVFPIEAEAGVPPQIQAHTLAEQQNPAKAREMAVIAGRAGVGRYKAFGDEAWTGYSEENWSWPDMIGSEGMAPSEPLVSRGECVEVGQEQFHGSQLAAEIRQACNKLTAEEREEALAHGMRLIYGGQCAAATPEQSTPDHASKAWRLEHENIVRQAQSARRQKYNEEGMGLIGAMVGMCLAMETAKLGCLLNPNLSAEALDRIFNMPAKHTFISLSGTPINASCARTTLNP